MIRRRKILLFGLCGVIAVVLGFITVKPVAVTLRDGTRLTVISETYGTHFSFTPDPNPIRRLWQEMRMHLFKKWASRPSHFAGTNDAVIWFKHTAVQGPTWNVPWSVLKEDGSPRTERPPWLACGWNNQRPGTIGVVWKGCPTNLPTLTFAFYTNRTPNIRWEEYTDATFMGRITVPNPAYRR